MPAAVIAERIGWDLGLTVLKEWVCELRPASRTVYEAGEIGRYDPWALPAAIPLSFGQIGHPPCW